jgi:hypothetical protein
MSQREKFSDVEARIALGARTGRRGFVFKMSKCDLPHLSPTSDSECRVRVAVEVPRRSHHAPPLTVASQP